MFIAYEGACGRQGLHTNKRWWWWNFRPCKRRSGWSWQVFSSLCSTSCFHLLCNVQGRLMKTVNLLKGLLGFAVDSTLSHTLDPSLGLPASPVAQLLSRSQKGVSAVSNMNHPLAGLALDPRSNMPHLYSCHLDREENTTNS